MRAKQKAGSLRGTRKMAGLTLVELMISILLGMIVIAGVIQVYVGSASSNSQLLRMTRLEEELSAIMTLMSADIRRAGYNTAAENPANLAVGWANPLAPLQVNGDCILYTYDAAGDGDPANLANRFGFRHDADAIEMFNNAAAGANWGCAGGAGWLPISTPGVVTIAELTLTLTEQCSNANQPALPCGDPAAAAGNIEVTTRYVDIAIGQAALTADPLVVRNLQESTRVRNDLIVVR